MEGQWNKDERLREQRRARRDRESGEEQQEKLVTSMEYEIYSDVAMTA